MADTSHQRRVPVAEGQRLRDWQVIGHLADGGRSSVYEVRFVGAFPRPGVPEFAAAKLTVPVGSEERATLVREYQAAAALEGHPAIVGVYDGFEERIEVGACVVLVHELGEESLAETLGRGPLGADDVRVLARTLASGLAALHEHGLVHSDVKPANILSIGGRWKLADLGAASALSTDAATSAAPLIGSTLLYLPPERAAGLFGGGQPAQTHRDADVWALGVVLHEAATGRPPFLDAVSRLTGTVSLDASLPPDLRRVVQQCLQVDRAARPHDGAAVMRLLDEGQTVPPPALPAPVAVEPPPALRPIDPVEIPLAAPTPLLTEPRAPRSRRRGAVVAIALATMIGGALVWRASLDETEATPGSAAVSSSPSTTIVGITTTPDPASTTTAPAANPAPDPAIPAFPDTAGWEAVDCELPIATSTEKAALMTVVVADFNAAAESAGTCLRASAHGVSSGDAAHFLVDDWPIDAANSPRPVVWTPASSAWGKLAEFRRGRAMSSLPVTSMMWSPLVLALPSQVAERLGATDGTLGLADLREAVADPGFVLVRTFPESSTAALSGLVLQWAVAGGDRGTAASRTDLQRSIEAGDVRYRDNTLDVLADVAAGELPADALVLEEKSVSDFNRGDPRGELAPGSTGTPPVDPLVAVLPSEGTVISDHPLYVLDDAWVTDRQREAAQVFVEFATSEPVQESVRAAGFRSFDEAPGDLGVPVISPPAGAVLAELQAEWQTARRRLEVRLLVDLSGSMAREERLELVEQALVEVAGSAMQADDQLGLTVFTTGLGGGGAILDERVALGPYATNGALLSAAADDLRVVPNGDTPLYRAISTIVAAADATADPSRISTVVVLTDGENDDPDGNPDRRGADELAALMTQLGDRSTPSTRVFTIEYGSEADGQVLRSISQAGGGRSYDARDLQKVADVLRQAISTT